MAKNQHNAGLHYRPLNQLGLSNFNDYIEKPIDSRFKFNPPPLKCGKLFGLCKADRQKEKLQKHCPWHPLLKMKAFTLEINGEAEYIWYCKECDCYYMNPFWRNGEKRMDTNRAEAQFADGSAIAIDCLAIEDEYGNTPAQRAELDWLLYNKPLECVQLVLSGEIEHYLSLGCDHGKLKD